jgi:hypothetical protein
VGICILLVLGLRPLFTYRARWAEPFVKEDVDPPETVEIGVKKRPAALTIALVVPTVLGLIVQLLVVFYGLFQPSSVLLAISWVSLIHLYVIHA